jgi:hypothetical protein
MAANTKDTTPTVDDTPQAQPAEADQGRKDAVEQSLAATDKLKPAEARLAQFPSLAGQPDVEVAERSADVHKASSSRHIKVFVAPPGFVVEGYDHTANFTATRQYMMGLGLRPDGDVEFDGASENVDGVSVDLTYSVAAIPAVIAVDPDVVHSRAVQLD